MWRVMVFRCLEGEERDIALQWPSWHSIPTVISGPNIGIKAVKKQ